MYIHTWKASKHEFKKTVAKAILLMHKEVAGVIEQGRN
jgi:hypothetical protein